MITEASMYFLYKFYSWYYGLPEHIDLNNSTPTRRLFQVYELKFFKFMTMNLTSQWILQNLIEEKNVEANLFYSYRIWVK